MIKKKKKEQRRFSTNSAREKAGIIIRKSIESIRKHKNNIFFKYIKVQNLDNSYNIS
jgi:hypothetical protein